MLYRVSGKLVNGQAFATRVDAPHAIGATVAGRKLLNDNDQPDENIATITAAPMSAKPNAIHIGAARTRKPKAAAKKK